MLSINPYQILDIYDAECLNEIKEAQKTAGTAFAPQKPHIFSIAAMAYGGLLWNSLSQAFVISGESGAGKTGIYSIKENDI